MLQAKQSEFTVLQKHWIDSWTGKMNFETYFPFATESEDFFSNNLCSFKSGQCSLHDKENQDIW